MKDKALNLALKALEECRRDPRLKYEHPTYDKAITAIKEALAQPEQHQDWCASLTQMLISMPPKPATCDCKPPKRKWVGLTDEEIAQGCKESWVTEQAWQSAVWWAEDKLKEKNS